MNDMKKCAKCGQDKPVSDFPKTNGKPYSYCKPCKCKYMKILRTSDPSYHRAWNLTTRERALAKVANGNPQCINCGCDFFPILEINHKNGGGCQERRTKSNNMLYRDIIAGRRSVEDLEVACRVCNALHFVRLKHGFLPIRVSWGLPTDPVAAPG